MTIEEALAILDKFLQQESLSDVQELVFCQVWSGRTYAEIAEKFGYDTDHIKRVGSNLWQVLSRALGEKVTKSNFRSVLRRKTQQTNVLTTSLFATDISLNSQNPQTDCLSTAPKLVDSQTAALRKRQDWGEAIDVSVFYGRKEELATLEQWIVKERCRLVAVLGMGGIGKTALAVKLAEQIQDEFEYLIWRSLRNAPPVQEMLAELILFFSNQQETELPATIEGRVLRLIAYLRQHRCLLVLDNAESILCSGVRAGQYLEGYEGYGQILRCVGETPHQSAVVLTSREKPKGFALKSGLNQPVRALKLKGLKLAEAQEIFRAKGELSGAEAEWRVLIEHYAGNPLALKMVVAATEDLFERNISKFIELLRTGTLVVEDIRDLLDRQFNRLSDLEKQIMYWLALNRERVSLLEISENIVPKISQSKLIGALECLEHRSLIEKNSIGFTQQPAVMEYMIERLIEQVDSEISTESLRLLMRHAILKATANDYARDSQIRGIISPLVDRIKINYRETKILNVS